MHTTIKIEEFAEFTLGIFLFSQLSYDTKVGAIVYNLFHHKAIGIVFIILGMLFWGELYTLVGVILFSHSAMDRMFGYGLKYADSFKNTHLGKIGK